MFNRSKKQSLILEKLCALTLSAEELAQWLSLPLSVQAQRLASLTPAEALPLYEHCPELRALCDSHPIIIEQWSFELSKCMPPTATFAIPNITRTHTISVAQLYLGKFLFTESGKTLHAGDVLEKCIAYRDYAGMCKGILQLQSAFKLEGSRLEDMPTLFSLLDELALSYWLPGCLEAAMVYLDLASHFARRGKSAISLARQLRRLALRNVMLSKRIRQEKISREIETCLYLGKTHLDYYRKTFLSLGEFEKQLMSVLGITSQAAFSYKENCRLIEALLKKESITDRS